MQETFSPSFHYFSMDRRKKLCGKTSSNDVHFMSGCIPFLERMKDGSVEHTRLRRVKGAALSTRLRRVKGVSITVNR